MDNQRQFYLSACCVLLFCFHNADVAQSEDTQPAQNVTVDPTTLKAARGDMVQVTCTSSISNADKFWVNPNGTLIRNLPDDSRFNDTYGVLTISAAAVADSGTYTCSVKESFNATAEITVYIMPDYFTEGMIILGINTFLLVVFLSCLLHSTLKDRRSRAKYTTVTSSSQT